MKNVRTRFAPSPTGFLHVGGVRTALFAWLLARQNGGKFILRIEDTDKAREVTGSEEHIIKSLKALGLNYDEGPDIDGPYGPYRQSERLEIYKAWAQILIEKGRAYADPYSQEELEKLREQAKSVKKPFLFRDHRPINPPKWGPGIPLRFKSEPKVYEWNDEVMGKLNSSEVAIDDFVIIKGDGFPTYNFSHIIDDHLMSISHVIRSQEFISSVPKYLNLYEALEFNRPILATMPPVLAPDGKKKLSKRDGAKDILAYLDEGYLPVGLINFMATLGWNEGTEQEIFSVEELIEKFKLNQVQKSGAHFDENRLGWINGVHIRNTPTEKLYRFTLKFWPKEADKYDDTYKQKVLNIIKERLRYLAELNALSNFFFKDLPFSPDLIKNDKKLCKLEKDELKDLLEKSLASFEKSEFSVESLNNTLNNLLEETNQKPGILFSLIRIATTQAPASPGLADTLSILGKEVTLRRIKQTVKNL